MQDYFGFTVVRDPLKRLLSLYTDRIIKRRDLSRCKTILRGQADLAIDPDPDYFFENFDAYVRASSVVKHHGLPMEVFTGTDLTVYDRIYRIEELGALAKDLAKVTGKTPTLKRRNQSKSKLDFSDLGKQAKEVLRQRLTPEYEHLSEFYPVPF